MSNELSMVNLKINEIITILMLQPQFEAPENYRDLAKDLANFKLQNSQASLREIRSMINAFEINREFLKEEPGRSYDDESFLAEFGDEPPDDECEYLSSCYSLKYDKEYKNSFSPTTLTTVERNVVLGLILQIKKKTGGYNEDFLTAMQDTLQLVGFSTPQIWEIMTQDLNPESQRFNCAEGQHVLQQEFKDTREYN